MNTPKDSFSRSSNDALSLPALKGGVSRANLMKYLYHITNKDNIKQIKAMGLSPEFSRTGYGIYFSQDQDHAKAYVGHHGDWYDGALLRVNVDKLDTSRLVADDCDYPDMIGEDYDDKDWKGSLKVSGQCMYTKTIRPEDIKFLSSNGKWIKLKRFLK